MTEPLKIPGTVTTLGEAIRWLREQRGLTLRALAAGATLSAPYLSDLEHNRRGAKEGTLEAIAAVLGVSVDVFEPVRGALSADLREWLSGNPEMVKLLREIRSSNRSVSEIRTAMRRK